MNAARSSGVLRSERALMPSPGVIDSLCQPALRLSHVYGAANATALIASIASQGCPFFAPCRVPEESSWNVTPATCWASTVSSSSFGKKLISLAEIALVSAFFNLVAPISHSVAAACWRSSSARAVSRAVAARASSIRACNARSDSLLLSVTLGLLISVYIE